MGIMKTFETGMVHENLRGSLQREVEAQLGPEMVHELSNSLQYPLWCRLRLQIDSIIVEQLEETE